MGIRSSQQKLSGIEKTSVILLSLPEKTVSDIMKQFTKVEIKSISQTMIDLGQLKPNLIETVFFDFVREISTSGHLVGSIENTKRFLGKVLPKEDVEHIFEEINAEPKKEESVWEKLQTVNENFLVNFLKNEHPQIISVILSHMPAKNAARVLELFPEDLSLNTLKRILSLEPIQKDILQEVERILEKEFMSSFSLSKKPDNHEFVAEIFNSMEKIKEKMFLEHLEADRPVSAKIIKDLMFTFEDFIDFDDNTIQIIIRHVDKSKLAIALKSVSDELRNLFFKNLSKRAAKMLAEDMQNAGSVRMRDIHNAQASIIAMVKEMANNGEIFISIGLDENDQIVR
jgi:flagellar motor switch protein FliG